jgi:penicillin-binding protein 1A
MKTALAKSKNMISIRILQAIGPQYAQSWVTRFGFDAERHPPYLTMALGAGSVTPMQLAVGYSAFANGGYRVNPYLISKVTDQTGKVLSQYTPIELNESAQAVSPQNAFVMSTLLQEVARSGTAAKATEILKRPDLYGKTGTTNDSMDAWFSGFQPTLAAITWIGYDTPKNLGSHETGGGLALPVWINFMQTALKGVPVTEITPPSEGVVREGTDWYLSNYTRSTGIINLGLNGTGAGGVSAEGNGANNSGSTAQGTSVGADGNPEEKKKILDLFKN